MQLKNASISRRGSRPQLLYTRRSHTLPCLPNSLFAFRQSVKSIKSLNVYCLAQIFNFLEFKDLSNCRLVCTYWNECVQFHLARRTHFAYGKALNNLLDGKKRVKNRKKVPLNHNIVLNSSLWYDCEKCAIINRHQINIDQKLGLQRQLYEPLPSHSPSPPCSEEGGNSSFSPNLSLTPISLSPSVSPTGANYSDVEFRCSDCQEMLKEFHLQLQQEMQAEEQNDEDEDYYSGFIDEINMDILEGILARMPRLTALKFAQG